MTEPRSTDAATTTRRQVSLVSYHEMGGRTRRLDSLYAGPAGVGAPREEHLYPHWHGLQGAAGDRGRSPVGYDDHKWRILDAARAEALAKAVDGGKVVGPSADALRHIAKAYPSGWSVAQLSHDRATVRGKSYKVSSGNRYATVAFLQDLATGIPVCKVSYHALAHIDTGGGKYGYTGKGPVALLALRARGIPNPAVVSYLEGLARHESLLRALKGLGVRVVTEGDWNRNAFADAKAMKTGVGADTPVRMLKRVGFEDVFTSGHITHGTDGSRAIDYVALSHGQPGAGRIVSAWTVSGVPSDHAIACARIEIKVGGQTLTFDTATYNIRATPPISKAKVAEAIHKSVRLYH